MKIKTTKKEILKNSEVFKIDYCQAQNLLSCENPFAYSAGVYGWSCDYFWVDGAIISTGYAPVGGQIPFELVKKYDKKAAHLIQNYYKDFDYNKHKKRLKSLLLKFIKEVRGAK